MKKIVSAILALMMCCMMLPAMAEEDLSGEWYASVEGMVLTLSLNADGTFAIGIAGMGTTVTGTWETENGNAVLHAEGQDAPLEGVLNGGTLTVTDGKDPLDFTREPIGVFTPAEVNPDAAAEDFDGTWKAVSASIMDAVMTLPDDEVNTVTIEGGVLTFAGSNESLSFLLGTDPITLAYEGGMLIYVKEVKTDEVDISLSIKAELLQDGMLAVTIDLGYGAAVIYLEKVAAEEPAA